MHIHSQLLHLGDQACLYPETCESFPLSKSKTQMLESLLQLAVTAPIHPWLPLITPSICVERTHGYRVQSDTRPLIS